MIENNTMSGIWKSQSPGQGHSRRRLAARVGRGTMHWSFPSCCCPISHTARQWPTVGQPEHRDRVGSAQSHSCCMLFIALSHHRDKFEWLWDLEATKQRSNKPKCSLAFPVLGPGPLPSSGDISWCLFSLGNVFKPHPSLHHTAVPQPDPGKRMPSSHLPVPGWGLQTA